MPGQDTHQLHDMSHGEYQDSLPSALRRFLLVLKAAALVLVACVVFEEVAVMAVWKLDG
jgi:hypothetical protein